MSLEGKATTNLASLSGKIHQLVIDKTLKVSGAAADSKAVGDAIDSINAVNVDEMEAMVKEAVDNSTVTSVEDMVEVIREEIAGDSALTAEEIQSICV